MGSSFSKAKREQSYVLVKCQFVHNDSIPNSQIQSQDAIYIKKNSVIPVFSDAIAGCNFQSILCLQCTKFFRLANNM